MQGRTPRGERLLAAMPYALPFVERLRLFQQFVDTEKATTTQAAHSEASPRGVRVRIRRGMVLEDGLRELNGLGPAMKRRLQVEFVNEGGAAETGVDVGGLFKEFCAFCALACLLACFLSLSLSLSRRTNQRTKNKGPTNERRFLLTFSLLFSSTPPSSFCFYTANK